MTTRSAPKVECQVSVTHSPDLVAASGFDESSTTDQTASVSTWVEMRRKSAPVKPKETSYASSEFSPGPNYPAFDFPFERIAIATTDKYATLTKSSLVTTQHKNPQLQPSLHPDPSHVSLSEFQRPTARNRPSQTGQAESYVSLRKRASHSMNSLTPSHNRLSTQTQQQEKEALDDSSSLGGVKQHPIVQWLLERQTEMMESVWFAKFILFLSNDRTQIIIYLAIMLFIHTMLVVLFILTLSIVMPGIWVYNFMYVLA
ncbi:hypothetical protein BC830DRAFT_717885 [Chytriomyces sp. MP71]|nr:hypothetical protein BC830DRAFT_717885 [Chytriomyces sp. MP71]